MERQDLIDQIVARVKEKIGRNVTAEDVAACLGGGSASCDACGASCAGGSGADSDDDRPGLLILTQEHGTVCHELLESSRLKEHFRTECALAEEYAVDLDRIQSVILFNLTVDAMAKIASGEGDTPYTSLAIRALLGGKKLYVLKDQVELFRYRGTAPAPYYEMMSRKLDLLVKSGLAVCEREQIEDCVLGLVSGCGCGKQGEACASSECGVTASCDTGEKVGCCGEKPQKAEKEIRITKKVITERDIIEADREKVTCIHLRKGNILTDLAKDAASKRNIRLVNE